MRAAPFTAPREVLYTSPDAENLSLSGSACVVDQNYTNGGFRFSTLLAGGTQYMRFEG